MKNKNLRILRIILFFTVVSAPYLQVRADRAKTLLSGPIASASGEENSVFEMLRRLYSALTGAITSTRDACEKIESSYRVCVNYKLNDKAVAGLSRPQAVEVLLGFRNTIRDFNRNEWVGQMQREIGGGSIGQVVVPNISMTCRRAIPEFNACVTNLAQTINQIQYPQPIRLAVVKRARADLLVNFRILTRAEAARSGPGSVRLPASSK